MRPRATGWPAGIEMRSGLNLIALPAAGWGRETPQQEGQRPRKYYRLTGEGVRAARLELTRASARRPRVVARADRPAPGSLG